jgi:hypothetical protein
MKILSGYAYEEARQPNPVAILLQQAAKRGQPVVLSCICRGLGSDGEGERAAAAATRLLMEWFYDRGTMLMNRHLRAAKVEQEIYGIWEQISADKACFVLPDLTGIFLLGHHFWLFQKGECPVYLLNQRYVLPNMKKLTEGESTFRVRSGLLQESLGILLCTPEYMAHLDKQEIAKCLNLSEIEADWQLTRRLEELQSESSRRQESRSGSSGCSADGRGISGNGSGCSADGRGSSSADGRGSNSGDGSGCSVDGRGSSSDGSGCGGDGRGSSGDGSRCGGDGRGISSGDGNGNGGNAICIMIR